MPLFALISLKDAASAVDTAMEAYTDAKYKIESGKWIASSKLATARELSIELGLRQAHAHLSFPLRGYSGRAQPDLWEWLGVQNEKEHA